MKNYLLLPVLVLTFGIFFANCSHKQLKTIQIVGETQGTYYSIIYSAPDSVNYQPAIDSLLLRFDSSLSTYKPGSIISRMNANDGTVRADQLFIEVWQKAMEVSKATNGAFDVTVGPLVNAWGFGFTDRMKVDRNVVDSLMPLVGFNKVQIVDGELVKSDPRQKIDFNAIAQGYAVDVVGRYLGSKGIGSFIVDIGGEVLAHGAKPDGSAWNVAIEKPAANASDDRTLQAVISLRDKAISTSGNYRKYFEENGTRYSHTIDPTTGYPVTHSLLSVSVLANDCITSDAFATAFMVMGLEKAKTFLNDHSELQAYFIFQSNDESIQEFHTKGFEAILQKR